MPDWGKIQFKVFLGLPWEEILNGASQQSRDLTSRLVRYEGSSRLTATEVCSP